jgi:hypothetical protein
MNRRTARGNRTGLVLTGLLLLAAGGYVLARGLAWKPRQLGSAGAPVITAPVRDFVTAHAAWFWPVIGITAAVLAVLAFRWLAVQGRTEAIGDFSLERDPRRGTTRLPASAVTDAFEDDLEASPYLQQASATLAGAPDTPRLTLTVTLQTGASPADAIQRIGQALTRLRATLDNQTVTATIRIRTTSTT